MARATPFIYFTSGSLWPDRQQLCVFIDGNLTVSEMIIREAVLEDMSGVLEIYNELIATSTAIYFDEALPLQNRIDWFHQRQREGYPIFVAVDDSGVLGFSSFGDFNPRPGYRFTVENSINLRADQRGKGLATRLMQPLIERAQKLGKHIMLGLIDGDNAASIRLHQKLGFEQTAFMPQVGYKFGRWLNLVIMQRSL